MIKRITILAMALCMSMVVANRVTGVALAQPQDDKMQSGDKMSDQKMASHDKMDTKAKKHKKDKMAKDKMKHDKMQNQDKMDQPKE